MQIRTENPLTQSYTHVVVSLCFKIISPNTLTGLNGLDVSILDQLELEQACDYHSETEDVTLKKTRTF